MLCERCGWNPGPALTIEVSGQAIDLFGFFTNRRGRQHVDAVSTRLSA